MYEVRFKDIDPDTGEISQDKRICLCEDVSSTLWIIHALRISIAEDADPNREVYHNKLNFVNHNN